MTAKEDTKKAWRAANPERARQQYRTANSRSYEKKYAWLQQWKLDQGCADCGNAWQLSVGPNPQALQLDHVELVRGRRRRDLPRLSMARIKEELAKCQVRCANCHAVRTFQQLRELKMMEETA